MVLLRSGGYSHRITYIGRGVYRLSWSYDTKVGRLRWPRCFRRDTDRKGAERFAKKWDVLIPEHP